MDDDIKETYGVRLNTFERLVFEHALRGLPGFRIAKIIDCPSGKIRAVMAEGGPVRTALVAAHKAQHRAAQEQRYKLLAMSFDEIQDQLSRPEDEVSLAEKRELAYQVFDRFGAPRVTHTKGEVRVSGAVAIAPMPMAQIEAQVAVLQQARRQIVEVLPAEADLPGRPEAGE